MYHRAIIIRSRCRKEARSCLHSWQMTGSGECCSRQRTLNHQCVITTLIKSQLSLALKKSWAATQLRNWKSRQSTHLMVSNCRWMTSSLVPHRSLIMIIQLLNWMTDRWTLPSFQPILSRMLNSQLKFMLRNRRIGPLFNPLLPIWRKFRRWPIPISDTLPASNRLFHLRAPSSSSVLRRRVSTMCTSRIWFQEATWSRDQARPEAKVHSIRETTPRTWLREAIWSLARSGSRAPNSRDDRQPTTRVPRPSSHSLSLVRPSRVSYAIRRRPGSLVNRTCNRLLALISWL